MNMPGWRRRDSPDVGVLRYGVLSRLRGNVWLLILPATITLVVTAFQLFWRATISDTLQVSTAEVMGSLMAGFFGANLLDAEFRQRAGEMVFIKPFPAYRLLAGRVFLSLGVVAILVGLNDTIVGLARHLHYFGPALCAGIAPSFFLCAVACSLFVASSNVTLAYIGPALLWIWSTIGEGAGLRLDRFYNPLLQISAWSDYLSAPSHPLLETLVGNNIALFLVGLALFGWSCSRMGKAVLQ